MTVVYVSQILYLEDDEPHHADVDASIIGVYSQEEDAYKGLFATFRSTMWQEITHAFCGSSTVISDTLGEIDIVRLGLTSLLDDFNLHDTKSNLVKIFDAIENCVDLSWRNKCDIVERLYDRVREDPVYLRYSGYRSAVFEKTVQMKK